MSHELSLKAFAKREFDAVEVFDREHPVQADGAVDGGLSELLGRQRLHEGLVLAEEAVHKEVDDVQRDVDWLHNASCHRADLLQLPNALQKVGDVAFFEGVLQRELEHLNCEGIFNLLHVQVLSEGAQLLDQLVILHFLAARGLPEMLEAASQRRLGADVID